MSSEGSVKDFLLKGGICHLATTDMVATQRALESYRELDPTFARYVSWSSFKSRGSVLKRGLLSRSSYPLVLSCAFTILYSEPVLTVNHYSTREHQLLVDLAESVENGK